jgi:hypothetical protein
MRSVSGWSAFGLINGLRLDKNPQQNLCGFGRFLAQFILIFGYGSVSTEGQTWTAIAMP